MDIYLNEKLDSMQKEIEIFQKAIKNEDLKEQIFVLPIDVHHL